MAAKRTSKGRKTGKSTATRKTAGKSRSSAASKKKATKKAPAKRKAAKKKPAKRAKKKASRRSSAPESSGRRASRAVTGSMARSSAKGTGAKPSAQEGPRPPAVSSRTSSRRGGAAESRDAGKAGTRIPHIADATLARIEAKLQEMRVESVAIVNRNVSTDAGGFREDAGVGDDMDLASRDREREFDLLQHERHLRRIQQIDEAFQRIKDGTYGLCEGTDEPINPRRLEIYPLARYSIEYQQEQEKMLGRTPEEVFFEEESNFESEEE